jgi:nucleotide-binding universal stress UspA family protein
MTALHSVLAATDFSPDSRYAVERTALLRNSAHWRGSVLHVVESTWIDSLRYFASNARDMEEKLQDRARAQLDELVANTRSLTGVSLEPVLTVGAPADALLAATERFDLLALGAHGTHAVRELALGTMAQRILRQTRKPVLVVRNKPEGPYRRVLVAVDFSPCSVRAAQIALNIAPASASIYLAHVFEAPFEGMMFYAGVADDRIGEYRLAARREAESAMRSTIASLPNPERLMQIVDHAAHAPSKLRDIAADLRADLIVAGRHGKSLTEHLLLGSVTQHLLAECACDVLVTQ